MQSDYLRFCWVIWQPGVCTESGQRVFLGSRTSYLLPDRRPSRAIAITENVVRTTARSDHKKGFPSSLRLTHGEGKCGYVLPVAARHSRLRVQLLAAFQACETCQGNQSTFILVAFIDEQLSRNPRAARQDLK